MPKENKQVEPIKEYYIAYFDLLGYKDFFEKNPQKAGSFLNTIYEAIENAKALIQGVYSAPIIGEFEKISIQVKVFSDNILLCLERGSTSKECLRFLTFMAITADIQRSFILKYDLFLRGGITIGMLSFNHDFIFGQGLIDAVALEETAIYPRIIIGQPIIDYAQQTHFVKQEDFKKAEKIKNRKDANEHISDVDNEFFYTIMSYIIQENLYLQLQNLLIFKLFDGVSFLNYLYCIGINIILRNILKEPIWELIRTILPDDYLKLNNLSPNQEQRLETHKKHIIKKIKKYGKYDNLDISAVKEANIREHILKKYLWTLSFHNYVCQIYHFEKCMIQSGSTCDIRFMKMTAEIFEDNPTESKPLDSINPENV